MTALRASRSDLLAEIRRHAATIVSHREEPCPYWKGTGCEASMVHDAEDILALVDQLERSLIDGEEQTA